MAEVFEPLKIKSIVLKNRIGVSPMCQYSAKDGFANDWHLVHLGSRAIGGAALVIAEATAISPEGRISPGDLGIWRDEQVDFLKRITTFISSQNSIPGIQLAHAGRKASHRSPWEGGKALKKSEGGWLTVAPSSIPFKDGDPIPEELSVAGIKEIVEDFENGALRAKEAGFKIIEIHAAHGYLIHEFLSPASNKRQDDYGGSFNSRISFLLQIVAAVRKVWPSELPLFVRISATDWYVEGWTIEDSVELAKMLKNYDVDLIDCSSGGNVYGVKIPIKPMYQVTFAETVKKEANILTAAVGLISTITEVQSIISNKHADLVLMARELLRNPYFPLLAAKQLGVTVPWPLQYARANK